MKKIVLGMPLAMAAAYWAAGPALAAPSHTSVVIAHFDDDGGHDHNGMDLDNDDPVTDQGPNKITPRVKGDEKTALGDDDDL